MDSMTDCTHTYVRLDFDGKEVQVPWARIFCPDCGLRLEPAGPTKPFRLRADQR